MNIRSLPACLRPCALAVLAVGAGQMLHAQGLPDTPGLAPGLAAPALQDTVVSATRTEQPLSDLVADLSIIERETIERSGLTGVADLLARLPGVEMARNGGIGGAGSVFLRAADSRHTAVFIDGVRVDSQTTGGAQWELIPLAQIDRIEVLRGPAAAVYGSDAIGGVIQLFTRKGEGPAKPYVGLGLGNLGSRMFDTGISGSAGQDGAFGYTLGLARDSSAGFDAKTGVAHNPDRDDYRSTSGHARLGWRIDARHHVDATLLANRMDAGYDEYSAAPPVDDRSLGRLRTAGLTWAAQWSGAYGTRLSVTDALSRYASAPTPYLAETRLRGYLWQNDYRRGAHRFSAALERREDALQNGPIDRSRAQDALALGYGLSTGRHTVQLNLRHDGDSDFGSSSTGSAAYGYALDAHWRATAALGSAFRAPTLYQRFSAYGLPTLQPERSRNIELGLRYGQGRSSFSLLAYRNRLRNLIAFAEAGPCASSHGCYANRTRAQYQGLTLAGALPLSGWQLHGALDLQNPRDPDSGRQLARRARRHATLGADTRLADWSVGAEVQASGRRFDNAANTKVLGGYALLNLYASTRIARDCTLLARIDNLADKDYQLARNYATPGRTLYVGVKWAAQ
ncbi:TonB-dependent receptor [Verminephrobacter eiseniae]|uniref:TonB-dependent receptor domain-containing protein n=1 Tax=Verminephrobacter eiseniae TaxID=364317 RepID=UPI0022378104|nr:TonB-dependent receptor [Verminephrobacter eiseniae]MCW5260719.1 TonB-dependent receptor [Verminephrobacter eiseniae]